MSEASELPEALANYFDALAESDFERAVEQFSEDGVYHHPPNFRDETAVEGREELLEYFSENRGDRDISHSIERVATDGDQCGFVGRLTGADIDGDDYFVSFAELEDGKIAYYMAGLLKGNV